VGDSRWLWILPALLAALFAALTTILAKVGVQGVSSNLATAVRTVVILAIAWGWVFATGEVQGLSAMSRRTWIFLILSGVATGLSWLFYFRALQRGPTATVAAIDKSSLALVLILSVVLLNEPLTWKSLLTVVLVLSGVLVAIL
jgi:bacterial/archaeal transporter family protein